MCVSQLKKLINLVCKATMMETVIGTETGGMSTREEGLTSKWRKEEIPMFKHVSEL